MLREQAGASLGAASLGASGSAPSTGPAVDAAPHLRSAETEFGVHEEYYEDQAAAWCGMHALNNLLGVPYASS